MRLTLSELRALLVEFEAGGAGPDVSADETMSGMFQACPSSRGGSRVGELPEMEREPDEPDEEEHEFWLLRPGGRRRS